MTIEEVHRQFFSLRNGIISQTLKDAGMPYPRIFGLQVPQISAIATAIGYDVKLARGLWNQKDCRESRLLACYLFDPTQITVDEALELCTSVATREEADILAWRLLRRMPMSSSLLSNLSGYMAEALKRNLE